jgi:hypothetical protein
MKCTHELDVVIDEFKCPDNEHGPGTLGGERSEATEIN